MKKLKNSRLSTDSRKLQTLALKVPIGRNNEVTSLPSWPGRKAGFHSTIVDGGRGGGTLSETKTQNENICYLCNIKTKK